MYENVCECVYDKQLSSEYLNSCTYSLKIVVEDEREKEREPMRRKTKLFGDLLFQSNISISLRNTVVSIYELNKKITLKLNFNKIKRMKINVYFGDY